MANSTGGPGLPGTRQWDTFFKDFTSRMSDLNGEIREAVRVALHGDEAVVEEAIMPSVTFTPSPVAIVEEGDENDDGEDAIMKDVKLIDKESETGVDFPKPNVFPEPLSTDNGKRAHRKDSDLEPKVKISKLGETNPTDEPNIENQEEQLAIVEENQRNFDEYINALANLNFPGNATRWIMDGHSFYYTGDRQMSMMTDGKQWFVSGNTDNSDFRRFHSKENRLIIVMNDMDFVIQPRNEISVEDIIVFLNNQRELEIEMPETEPSPPPID